MYQPYPGQAQLPETQRPPAPASVLTAVKVMYAGAAASLLGIVIDIVTVSATKTAIQKRSPHLSASQINSSQHVLVAGFIAGGVIAAVVWIVLARACLQGRNWDLLSVAQSNGIGRHRVTEVLRLTGMEAVAGRRVNGYSLGMKQRLGLAAALLGDPPILMFDEPVNGLDTEGIHWIRRFFKELAAEGRTVLVSSHLMTEMALTADHLIVIGRGRLLADTPTDQLIDSSARRDVLLRSPRAAELAGLLAARGATVTPQPDGALVVTGLDAAAIGDLAAGHGIALHALVPRQASLEDAYLDLTGESTDYRAPAA